MANCSKIKFYRKNRIIRLLTLFCFFHFSGLNNGFTCVVGIAGNVGAMNFTPLFVSNIAPAFNPMNWRPFLSVNKWIQLFSQSNQIIQSSCKNIVQEGLLNMDFSEIGFEQDLENKLSEVLPFTPNRERSSISSVVGKVIQILLAVPSIKGNYKADEVPEYFHYKERWLTIIPGIDLRNWYKYKKKNIPPGCSLRWNNLLLQYKYVLERSHNRSELFRDIHRNKIARWLVENVGGRNDAAGKYLSRLVNNQCRKFARQTVMTGNFFVRIKRLAGDIN